MAGRKVFVEIIEKLQAGQSRLLLGYLTQPKNLRSEVLPATEIYASILAAGYRQLKFYPLFNYIVVYI